MKSTQSIPEIFSGKHVAITGATGFIGQLIAEKLLRSCPGVEQIYLLIRSKDGDSCHKRLKKITELKVMYFVFEN